MSLGTFKIGDLEIALAVLDAGVLEDCEDDVQRFLAIRDGYPVGKAAGAIITLLHRALSPAAPHLSRDDVRRAIPAGQIVQAANAVGRAFGFKESGTGEAGAK